MKLSLFLLIIISLTNCKSKSNSAIKVDINKTKFDLVENLTDFTSEMSENDTVKVIVNLSMEYWVRMDEIELTKRNSDIYLNTLGKII